MLKTFTAAMAAMLVAAGAIAQIADSPIPPFEATSLTGKTVHSSELIGQPAILIVMPSRDAAERARAWADALQSRIDPDAVKTRAVLAIDLPFFIDEQDALGRAREKVPARYHDQTWLFAKDKLETALDIPTSSRKAFVLVLDPEGSVLVRVSGAPTERRLNAIASTVQSLR